MKRVLLLLLKRGDIPFCNERVTGLLPLSLMKRISFSMRKVLLLLFLLFQFGESLFTREWLALVIDIYTVHGKQHQSKLK
jgi:hypothetical protein